MAGGGKTGARRGSRAGARGRADAVEAALASYVDPRVVCHILSHGRAPLPSGVRRTVSCLFADVRGFTRFAAGADPNDVVAVLDAFFASACAVAVARGGEIDKLIGDAVMVIFDDPGQAVAAAIEMIERFDGSRRGGARRGPRLALGVGIATGPVVLVNVGAPARMDYTVVGATVNLASRLAGEANGGEVLCDQATARAARAAGDRDATSPRSLRLKGVRGVVRARAFRVAGRLHASRVATEVDPVCGMKIAPDSPHAVRYAGRVHRFCSSGCRTRFARHPAAYAPM